MEGEGGTGEVGSTEGCGAEPPGTAGTDWGKVWTGLSSSAWLHQGPRLWEMCHKILEGLSYWGPGARPLWVGGVSFSGDPIVQHLGIG